jgi:hypothetical protein
MPTTNSRFRTAAFVHMQTLPRVARIYKRATFSIVIARRVSVATLTTRVATSPRCSRKWSARSASCRQCRPTRRYRCTLNAHSECCRLFSVPTVCKWREESPRGRTRLRASASGLARDHRHHGAHVAQAIRCRRRSRALRDAGAARSLARGEIGRHQAIVTARSIGDEKDRHCHERRRHKDEIEPAMIKVKLDVAEHLCDDGAILRRQ